MIMPYLEKMSVAFNPNDVSEVYLKLEETMKEKFFALGLWHEDPAWRNVALVRDKKGKLSKVCMIDLEPERMRYSDKASLWDFEQMWNEFKTALEKDWEAFELEDEGIS
jgi:hypothetical protein